MMQAMTLTIKVHCIACIKLANVNEQLLLAISADPDQSAPTGAL